MYRQILAGHIRGVYTGTFAEQAIEMDVKETVVRVRKEDLGGKGSMLCAGFDDEEDGEAEIKKIKEGYGNEVIRDLEQAADEEGWTKEILLSGRARTSWGWATVRGRVRSWDGLVTLAIAYSVSEVVTTLGPSHVRVSVLTDLAPRHGSLALARLPSHRRQLHRSLARYIHIRASTRLRRRLRDGPRWGYLLPSPLPDSSGRLTWRGRFGSARVRTAGSAGDDCGSGCAGDALVGLTLEIASGTRGRDKLVGAIGRRRSDGDGDFHPGSGPGG
jgi:hypothetical protein